jgi:hypothetical protein
LDQTQILYIFTGNSELLYFFTRYSDAVFGLNHLLAVPSVIKIITFSLSCDFSSKLSSATTRASQVAVPAKYKFCSIESEEMSSTIFDIIL